MRGRLRGRVIGGEIEYYRIGALLIREIQVMGRKANGEMWTIWLGLTWHNSKKTKKKKERLKYNKATLLKKRKNTNY